MGAEPRIKDIRDMYEKSAETSSLYCEETEKMARYMKQLNSVYEKMIEHIGADIEGEHRRQHDVHQIYHPLTR